MYGDKTMTWDELKTYVDQELLAKGEKGNIEIWYIDITCPTSKHPPYIEISKPLYGNIKNKTLIMSDFA